MSTFQEAIAMSDTFADTISDQLCLAIDGESWDPDLILAMPEMEAIRKALVFCYESFDFFRYDYLLNEPLPESVMAWMEVTG